MKPKKPRPETVLIPEDELKSVVAGLTAIPKAEVETMESDRPKKASPKKGQA